MHFGLLKEDSMLANGPNATEKTAVVPPENSF